MTDLLGVGSRVWFQDSQQAGGWIPATVQSLGADGTVQLLTPASSTITAPASSCHLQNPEDETVEDMTRLLHLHEPGVLHNLSQRYAADTIYTNTGSILIAVNPFKPMPQLFESAVLDQYRAQAMQSARPSSEGARQQAAGSALPPHVYAVACGAYMQMLRDAEGQAILITGESGAGKTETSKLIMRCLASLGGEHNTFGDDDTDGSMGVQGGGAACSVEQKVLESNPLLEAFGNAKTLRNDNSSRFGKYVEIQFSERGELRGAAVRTYLLERSRLVHVAPGERNFHAFYQMCAGASAEERARWQLGAWCEYAYLNQSQCFQLPGVDDAAEYQHTRHAMSAVGISGAQQEAVFRLLAAILHLGNVRFREVDHSTGELSPAEESDEAGLQAAAELLGVEPEPLAAVLTTRTRQTPEGPITSNLTVSGAEEARNALSKVLYARLFSWLVAQINTSMAGDSGLCAPGSLGSMGCASTGSATAAACPAPLNAYHTPGSTSGSRSMSRTGSAANAAAAAGTPAPETSNGVNSSPSVSRYTIGLLDIYGFESFESNDLEQLCINLANEKLQQHFNQHVFKWEQAEYTAEGIDWRYIEFVDNQDVLDLVEGRMGLLDLLDEQCRFPSSNAEDLANKYATTPSVGNNKRFEKLKRPPTGFAIEHYAGSVKYTTDNFMDKNVDYVVAEHASLMASASSPLVSDLFLAPQGPDADGNGNGNGAGSTGANGTPGSMSRVGSSQGMRGSGFGGSSAPNLNGLGGGGAMKSSFKFDSVGSQFKRQLADLMSALNMMQPHYVRCIKPNPGNVPGVFESRYVLHQLRCGGVMEAVNISCAGFAYKRPYRAFVDYFWPLCPAAMHDLQRRDASNECCSSGVCSTSAAAATATATDHGEDAAQEAALRILEAAGVKEYQLGRTKVFLRSLQAKLLDRLRSDTLAAAATKLQARWKGFLGRRAFVQQRSAAVNIQAHVRGWLARRLAESMRRTKAATTIQAAWRCVVAQRALAAARKAAVMMQSVWRMRQCKLQLVQLRREHAAVVFQSLWRMRGPRTTFLSTILQHRAARTVQAAWRGWLARREYQRTLVYHRAAARIQRAWRSQQKGERLREAFRSAALRVLDLSRAALVFQTAWRAKAGRLALAKERHEAQRRRFREQLQRFQQGGPSAAPAPSAPRALHPAGATSLQKAASTGTQGRPAKVVVGKGQVQDAGADVTPHQDVGAGPSAHSTARDAAGVVRAYDDAGALSPNTRKAARTKELKNFKLTPLLQHWKQVEASTQGSAPRGSGITGRAASVKVPGPHGSPANSMGSRGSGVSFGELLDLAATPVHEQ